MTSNPSGKYDPDKEPWDPEKAREAIRAEQVVFGTHNPYTHPNSLPLNGPNSGQGGNAADSDGETPAQYAQRMFHENSPIAAQAIIHLAVHSPNEKMRFDAARYITERVLGPTNAPTSASEESPLTKLLTTFVSDIEDHANNGS